MSWTKSGTISITAGSLVVTGEGTTWLSDGMTRAGDILLVGGTLKEVASVASDTRINLQAPWAGPTWSGQAYALIHTGLLPAELALKISDLQAKYLTTVSQLLAWETSTADKVQMTVPGSSTVLEVTPLLALLSQTPADMDLVRDLLTASAAASAASASSAAASAALAASSDVGTVAAAFAAHQGVGGSTHPNATPNGLAGFMSSADKSAIDRSHITVEGDLSPYITTSTTLTITNFDSATTYSATATGGAVVSSGNGVFQYTAGVTAGSFAVSITAGGVSRTIPLTVKPAAVLSPTITSPTNGAVGLGATPSVSTGTFAVIGGADTHTSTDWEVRTAANGGGEWIARSLADTTNKTSWTIPANVLAVNTTYWLRVRHIGALLGASPYQEISFKTMLEFPPTVPGTAYRGGFYAGRIVIGGITYAIVVSPKASGQLVTTFKVTADTTSGTSSLNDGLTNMSNMGSANHPAAAFCRGLTIGGYTDWYIPSRDELELCYRNLKPTTGANAVYSSRMATWAVASGVYNGVDAQGNGDNDNSAPLGVAYTSGVPTMTTAAAFQDLAAEYMQTANYHFSSTELSPGVVWTQGFASGYQDGRSKLSTLAVRAVRRVAI